MTITDGRANLIYRNLGFPNAADWTEFWIAYNTRSGDYSPYGPKNSSAPEARLQLIMAALHGQTTDLRSLPEYQIEAQIIPFRKAQGDEQ